MSQRLRGVGEEGEDLTPKLEEAFSTLLGTTIRDANGELKSTFDLLTIMAERTDELNSVQRQYIFELAAGKRQVPVLEAIVSNWESVTSATEASANSINSAQKEQEIFLDSIQGRYQTTIAQIQEFWSTLINSDAIKELVTGFGNLVEVLTDVNKTFGSLPVIIIAVSQAMIALKGTQIAGFFSSLVTTVVQSAQGMAGMTIVTEALTVSVGALQASLGIIAIALVAVAKATQGYKRSLEEARQEQEKFAQANKELNEIINEGTKAQLKNRIEALEGLSTQYALLSMRLGQLKLAQNEINTSTDEGVDKLMQNRRAQKELQQQIDLLDKSMSGLGTTGANVFNRLDELRDKLDELEEEEEELVNTQYDFVSSSEKKLKILTELELKYRDIAHSISINRELLSRLDSDDKARIPILESLIDKYKEQQDNLHNLANAQRDALESGKLNREEQQLAQAEIQKLGREWQALESSIISASKEIEQIPLDIAKKQLKEYKELLSDLNDELDSLADTLDESLESQITRLEEARDKSSEAYQSDIDDLKDKLQTLKDANDEQERANRLAELQLDLAKARQRLSNVEKELTAKVYVEGEGFIDVADPSAVESALADVADLEKSLAEEERSQAQTLAEEDLQAQIDKLEEEQSNEEDSFNKRITNLKQFQKNYQNQIEKDGQIQESLLKGIYGALRLENEKYFQDTISGYQNMIEEINSSLEAIGDVEAIIDSRDSDSDSPKIVRVRDKETGKTGTIHKNTYLKDKDRFELLNTGGIITQEGMAYLHKNEPVLNPAQVSRVTNALGIGGGSEFQNAQRLFSFASQTPNIQPIAAGNSGSSDTIFEIGNLVLEGVQSPFDLSSQLQDMVRQFRTNS